MENKTKEESKRKKEIKTKRRKLKIKNKSNTAFKLSLASFACLLTIGLVLLSTHTHSGYDLQENLPSTVKIMADQMVENIIATEQNRIEAQDAADRLEPIMQRDESVLEWITGDINSFFENTDMLRRKWQLELAAAQPQPDIDEETGESINTTQPPDPKQYDFGIPLSSNSAEILLGMDDDIYSLFREQVYTALGTTLEKGIRNIDDLGLRSLETEVDRLGLNADTKELCFDIISEYLRPNIIENEEETSAAREKRAQEYETVYFLEGQTIVDEGQLVTEEIYAVLESLGLLSAASRDTIIPDIGIVGLIITVFIVFIFYFKLFYKNAGSFGTKEAMVLFAVYTLTILITYAFSSLPYFALPILLSVLLISILLDGEIAIILTPLITVICYLIYKGDMRFIMFFMLSGSFMVLLSTFTTERSKVILAGIISSVINAFIATLVLFIFDKKFPLESLYFVLICGGAGIVSVILAIGTLPFWEATFGIITPIKLLDLANPNSPLLRRLTREAPGTYHHSLIVANLAEAAAYDVGANPNLARVGAYYHDIGKLKHPSYFFENQVGSNPHDEMDPRSSVHVIVSHITYGLQLAAEYRLPNYVTDMISQHHGDTPIKYFYHKAKAANPDTEIPEGDFRYHFPRPQTKEAAIIMLADTVEAAVRSKVDSVKDSTEMEAYVRTLVRDKRDDGQLNECPLTLKDIETIIESFLGVFRGMYHERIPYPEQEAKN